MIETMQQGTFSGDLHGDLGNHVLPPESGAALRAATSVIPEQQGPFPSHTPQELDLRISTETKQGLYGLLQSGDAEKLALYSDIYDKVLNDKERADFQAFREEQLARPPQPRQAVVERPAPTVSEAAEPAPTAEAPKYEKEDDTWKYRLYNLKLEGDDTAFRKKFSALTAKQKAWYDNFEHLENARIQVMHPHLAYLAVRHTADRPVGWVHPENAQPVQRPQQYHQHVARTRPALPAVQPQTHPEAARPQSPRKGKLKAAMGRLVTRLSRR